MRIWLRVRGPDLPGDGGRGLGEWLGAKGGDRPQSLQGFGECVGGAGSSGLSSGAASPQLVVKPEPPLWAPPLSS